MNKSHRIQHSFVVKGLPLKLIDTHIHLDDARYNEDRPSVMQCAREAGVALQVSIGTHLEDSLWAAEFALQEADVFATVGMHPELVDRWKEGDEQRFLALAKKPKVVAIGEVGMDYHRGDEDKALQERVFRLMIGLSRERKLPLVVHQRDAAQDTLRILREEKAGGSGGVFHCFAGDWATAQEAMAMGFYIAVGGILTFPSAKDLRGVIGQVPMERLVLETDGPWLAPQLQRGKRNEAAFLPEVCAKLAELKGMSIEDVARISTENACKLFNISL
jgi:TatD DNase family protein